MVECWAHAAPGGKERKHRKTSTLIQVIRADIIAHLHHRPGFGTSPDWVAASQDSGPLHGSFLAPGGYIIPMGFPSLKDHSRLPLPAALRQSRRRAVAMGRPSHSFDFCSWLSADSIRAR